MTVLRFLLAGTALLVTVWAQQPVALTEWPEVVKGGQPTTLRWTGDSSPAKITLQKGPADNLQDVQVLTDNAKNGEYNWTPSGDLADGNDYAFQISQNGQTNYSPHIQVSGGSSAPVNAPSPAQAPETSATSGVAQSVQASSQAPSTMRTNSVLGSSSTSSSVTASRTPSATPSTSKERHTSHSATHHKAVKTSESTASATHATAVALKPTATSKSESTHTGSASHLTGSAVLGAGAAFCMFFL